MRPEDRLRRFSAPDEDAAARRAREVARAAFASREPGRRARRGPRLAVAAVVLAAVAISPPGVATAEWVRDLVRDDGPEMARSPAVRSLPAPGRVLVTGRGGTWVVRSDGAARRLGRFDAATWSPRGLFVAATRGSTLAALEPDGTPRWTLGGRAPLSQPVWSPDGFRVAYRSGSSVRVVAGDGGGDRLVLARAGAAAPAIDARHHVAAARADGGVEVRDADTGRRLWRSGRSATPPAALVWTPRGLAVVRGAAVELHGRDGEIVRRTALPGRGVHAVGRPGTSQLVVSLAGADGVGRVVVAGLAGRGTPRTLLASPGAVREVAVAPDGSVVLVARPGAGEWVFLPVGGGRARAVTGVAAQFDPGGPQDGPLPVLGGWAPAP